VASALSSETNLTIEKLVYGGDGLARVDGQVVFIPYVLPGEVVRADVERAKNDLLRGRLREIVTPAASRVEPRCPYYYRCGGCQYQHADYAFQLEQKRDILREVLRRVGKIEFEGEIGVVSGEPWGYRNRIQLHLQNGAIGYFEAGSHKLCAIDRCPIASPKLNETIARLGAEAPNYRGLTAGVELFTNEANVQVNVLDRIPRSARSLFEAVGSPEPVEYAGFRVSRNSFFQVNRFLVDALVDAACEGLAGEHALDLYAGGGLFAKRLSSSFAKVAAVESGWSAFHDLEHNLAGTCVTPEQGTAEEFLAGVKETPDAILADPPRIGLGKVAIAELLRLRAYRLALVSCDPATLARDLRALLAGGYRIERITMLDLFPQTAHLETVLRLAR
jgi:23S rRNA (uracil1939-C5)-methyltransferase